MFARLFNGAVIVCWLVAMTWLLVEKVIPPLLDGEPPDYQSSLVGVEHETPPDAWRIRWKEQSIGFAASRIVPRGNRVETHSFVEFEDLPLESILSELLGPLSAVIQPFLKEAHQLDIDLHAATRMQYDEQRRLTAFDTTLDLGDVKNFLKLRGQVQPDGKLRVSAQLSDGGSSSGRVFNQTIQLPPEALVESSLSPRSELKNLQVGQTWTIPVFRAFPPNSPVQIVQAEVQPHELIIWGSREVETLPVAYRTDAGSGVNATREPVSREWIDVNGRVLRTEVSFSGVKLTFEREPDDTPDDRLERLEALQSRLWSP